MSSAGGAAVRGISHEALPLAAQRVEEEREVDEERDREPAVGEVVRVAHELALRLAQPTAARRALLGALAAQARRVADGVHFERAQRQLERLADGRTDGRGQGKARRAARSFAHRLVCCG